MTHNTIPGSRRQKAASRDGEILERGYIYLPAECWTVLYARAKAVNMSASQYIESLIPAVSGTYQVKENNVSVAIQPSHLV